MFSEEVDDLKVNEAYAARFNRRERSKELQGLRREHSKEVAQTEEHSSASEDEDGVLLTGDLDLQIMRTIDSIKHQRSEVYERDGQFFRHAPDGGRDTKRGGGPAVRATRLRDRVARDGAEAALVDGESVARVLPELLRGRRLLFGRPHVAPVLGAGGTGQAACCLNCRRPEGFGRAHSMVSGGERPRPAPAQ